MTLTAEADPARSEADGHPVGRARRHLPAAVAVLAALVLLAVVAAIHLTQGTSTVGVGDLLDWIVSGDQRTWNVLAGSRIPRLVAGLVVGLALGGSGAALQSVARNHLASPDLLGVAAGAYFAVTLSAALGIEPPVWVAGSVAFSGGLFAALLVMVLSAGGAAGPTRLVLAGAATSMALSSGTSLLLILFEEETRGLYAWGSGSLLAVNLDASIRMMPVLLAGLVALAMVARKLDILALGDDAAAALGVGVRSTRVLATVLAVLLAAAAVTVAGPVGFVGLCGPVLVRLVASRSPNLLRHRVLVPLSALAGAIVVLGADVGLRTLVGAARGVEVPTGVATSLLGSLVLIALARQHRDSGPVRDAPSTGSAAARSRRRFVTVLAVAAVVLVVLAVVGVLVGGRTLLLGDVVAWIQGTAGRRTAFMLDARAPRVLAAILAGAALALAGTSVQAVSRNPLAEPGILGVTAGAGLGAVLATTFVPGAGVWVMSAAAVAGAALSFVAVYTIAWRGGLSADRLVLVGIGVSAALGAVTVMVLVATDPWDTPKALTWLSGTTYGRQFPHLVPLGLSLAVLAPVLYGIHRLLDLLAIDDDVPRVLGVRLERARFVSLLATVVLTAGAVTAVGVVGFVGLVAPHAARALVGGAHRRVLLVAALLGAGLVSVADTLGRSVIAPAQIPAGLLTSLIGTPYFVWLLWRSRSA